MNSAKDSAQEFLDGDFMPVELPTGIYVVESSDITSKYVGYFHKFTRKPS